MTKLQDFLSTEKIDPRRLPVASRRVDALRPEDRQVLQARRVVRSGKGSEADKEKASGAARKGRPLSRITVSRALRGGSLSRASKQKILRAVNHVRSQKKQDPVELSKLF